MGWHGNGQDFGAFYVKHAPLVRRLLAQRGVRSSDLDDVLQDAFVTINRLLPEFEGRSSIETWLHSVTWRVASQHLRARKNSELTDVLTESVAAHGAEAMAPSASFHAMLGQLDERQREALVLREVAEMSISELSELTGNARATIRDRIDRGRKALGMRLWRSFTDVESPAWLDQLAPRSAARLAQLERPSTAHVICDGNAIAAMDDIAIVLWRGPSTVAALDALIELMFGLIDRHPEGIRYLSVIDPVSTPPDREGRQLIAWGLGKMGHKLRAAAWSIEDLSMRAAVAPLMNACLFIGGVPVNIRMFDGIEPADRWLNGYGSTQPIVARIEELRMQLKLAALTSVPGDCR
jgi:RNA polymerase sigma-70 factor (ECF subfamily)